MATHNLTHLTKVVPFGDKDLHTIPYVKKDDPASINPQDEVYKGKPFEQGALFLLAEIRDLLESIEKKIN